MEKFTIKVTFQGGGSVSYIVDAESYSAVASDIMSNEEWMGVKGRLVNKKHVLWVDITEGVPQPKPKRRAGVVNNPGI